MSRQIFNNRILPAKDKMYRFARHLLYSANGTAEDAHDIVQDALLKIWDQRDQLKEIKNPEAWCMRITKNLCIDRFRASKAKQKAIQQFNESNETVHHTEPGETEKQPADLDEIKKIIDELPEKYRIVIHLREIEGFTYREIAEITEWDINKVKVTLFRARKKLKEQLMKNKTYDFS
jgi:RNA polymerase sigma-70 factor (ECF subfamily)